MMNIRKIFQEMSSWAQLLFFFLLWGFGFVLAMMLSGVVAVIFASIQGLDISSGNPVALLLKNANFVRIVQVVQQVCLFLIPAVLCSYLFNKDTWSYLKVDKPLNVRITAASVLLVLVIQPIINLSAHYNKMMQLPESMSGIENWMKETEANSNQLIEFILTTDSTALLLVNIFVVAVMAALVEEFFFRGSLQQIFNRVTSNHHAAIWITAFIFSAIHMQFYGFIPRLLLGALLGYVFIWSGNLWVPVIVHFANNAMSVLLFHFYHGTPEYDSYETMGVKDTWGISLLSALLVVTIVTYLVREYRKRRFAEL